MCAEHLATDPQLCSLCIFFGPENQRQPAGAFTATWQYELGVHCLGSAIKEWARPVPSEPLFSVTGSRATFPPSRSGLSIPVRI
jgi:hypothetical protein